MKIITFLFIFISTSITFSQSNFTLEWESPAGLYFMSVTYAERTNQTPELIFRDASYTMKVYDGSTKQLKYSYPNPDSSIFSYFNSTANSTIDVNSDGINEVILYKNTNSPFNASIKVLNGANGQMLYQNTYSGKSIYVFPIDIDSDNFIELCIPQYNPSLNAYDKLIILSTTSSPIGLSNNQNTATNFNLGQNYPNPFNPSTTIEYSLSKQSDVLIKLYDVLGQEVKTLVDDKKGIGSYKIEFDGSGLSSGTYFYQITLDGLADTKKMVLIK